MKFKNLSTDKGLILLLTVAHCCFDLNRHPVKVLFHTDMGLTFLNKLEIYFAPKQSKKIKLHYMCIHIYKNRIWHVTKAAALASLCCLGR